MATIRFGDPLDTEAQKPPKQLTIRERRVLRSMMEDFAGKDTSTLVEQISEYLTHKDCDFQRASIERDDDKWLVVKVQVGRPGITAFDKSSAYEFKARHPSNPTRHAQKNRIV